MMKFLRTLAAGGVLSISFVTLPPAQAGPVLDEMKEKAQAARGIAVEGSVILKHSLKQKSKQAGGIAREGSLILSCKARDALKLKKC